MLSNGNFAEPGAQPGEALHWRLHTFVSAERIAAFGPEPRRAAEDFERWSAWMRALDPQATAVALFGSQIRGVEGFHEGWGNDAYLSDLPAAQLAAALFTDQPVERFDVGWRNEGYAMSWDAVNAAIGMFSGLAGAGDAGPRESFEAGWRANEAFAFSWDAVTPMLATFATGQAVERFEASWPSIAGHTSP